MLCGSSAACLVALMVGLGYLVAEVLPSTAVGRWDAEVPRRLVEYRQQQGISESKLIPMLSETQTIIVRGVGHHRRVEAPCRP
jgi:hypothetical protein